MTLSTSDRNLVLLLCCQSINNIISTVLNLVLIMDESADPLSFSKPFFCHINLPQKNVVHIVSY